MTGQASTSVHARAASAAGGATFLTQAQDPRRLALFRIFFCAALLAAGPPWALAAALALMLVGALGRWAALGGLGLLLLYAARAPEVWNLPPPLWLVPPFAILVLSCAWDAYSLDALRGLYFAGENDEDDLNLRSANGLYSWPLAAALAWAGVYFLSRLAQTSDLAAAFRAFRPIDLLWLAPLLLPVQKLLEALCDFGRSLYPVGRRIVVYDGDCGFCMRTAMVLKRLDVFRLLEYVNFRASLDSIEPRYRREVTPEMCVKEMFYLNRGGAYGGYHGFRALAWAIPAAWPALPVLYLPPVAAIGVRCYRWVADNRLNIPLKNIEKCRI